MTNPDYTAIILLVDRSGSMCSIKEAAEEDINGFIAGQAAADGRRTIRIAQFDHVYELVTPSTDPKDFARFHLEPRGSTALLDSMGRAINEFGGELAAMPEEERPGTVIFAVMTDGLENASTDYTWERIKELVERQEHEYAWQVLYLGANQDAIAVGAKLGVRPNRSMTYAASSVGTRAVYASTADYVAAASRGETAAFTDEDRKKATEE
jgi:hypothetical protein